MSGYAKESEVQAGTILIADGGFTCIKEGAELTVQNDPEFGLYVPCSDSGGKHMIDGQLDDRGHYIGLSRKASS
jgi:hypothetical protein